MINTRTLRKQGSYSGTARDFPDAGETVNAYRPHFCALDWRYPRKALLRPVFVSPIDSRPKTPGGRNHRNPRAPARMAYRRRTHGG